MAEADWDKKQLVSLLVRPPWHPSAEDVSFVRAMTARALAAYAAPAILVLGMTRQLVQAEWPSNASVTAVDASAGIVASMWKVHPTLPSRAVCASWQSMPFGDGTFGAVVGDGSLNALPDLEEYPRVFAEIARVLRGDGVLVLRCFLRPDAIEAPEDVIAKAHSGAFPTTAAFRFRFCLSLARENASVDLATLHDMFNALVPDRDALARVTGWPRTDIDRVDVDKDSKVRFTFPTEAELVNVTQAAFSLARMERGTYAQAEQCPTILFRPA